MSKYDAGVAAAWRVRSGNRVGRGGGTPGDKLENARMFKLPMQCGTDASDAYALFFNTSFA